jgi:hypothetical protein
MLNSGARGKGRWHSSRWSRKEFSLATNWIRFPRRAQQRSFGTTRRGKVSSTNFVQNTDGCDEFRCVRCICCVIELKFSEKMDHCRLQDQFQHPSRFRVCKESKFGDSASWTELVRLGDGGNSAFMTPCPSTRAMVQVPGQGEEESSIIAYPRPRV